MWATLVWNWQKNEKEWGKKARVHWRCHGILIHANTLLKCSAMRWVSVCVRGREQERERETERLKKNLMWKYPSELKRLTRLLTHPHSTFKQAGQSCTSDLNSCFKFAAWLWTLFESSLEKEKRRERPLLSFFFAFLLPAPTRWTSYV